MEDYSLLYPVDEILADGLTEGDIRRYAGYLNGLATFSDVSEESDDDFTVFLYDVIDNFLTKNSDTILVMLYSSGELV